MRNGALPERLALVATRTTVHRTRSSTRKTVRGRKPANSSAAAMVTPSVPQSASAGHGERLLQSTDLADARAFRQHSCACMRSPRAIAHWLLSHGQPTVEPTSLALDREEAGLWSSTLTGRLKISHSAVDGTCSLDLHYADGRTIAIAMDELRLAATATA